MNNSYPIKRLNASLSEACPAHRRLELSFAISEAHAKVIYELQGYGDRDER